MAFPIKTCVACGDEFELRPGKPGFANRCPTCPFKKQSLKG
jgi:DNA-directed RNA polymerase subunit RPC12/RpoP